MSIRCLHPSGRVRRKPFWLWVITFWVLGGIVTAVFSDTITEISSGLAYSQVNGGFSFLICYALLYIALADVALFALCRIDRSLIHQIFQICSGKSCCCLRNTS